MSVPGPVQSRDPNPVSKSSFCCPIPNPLKLFSWLGSFFWKQDEPKPISKAVNLSETLEAFVLNTYDTWKNDQLKLTVDQVKGAWKFIEKQEGGEDKVVDFITEVVTTTIVLILSKRTNVQDEKVLNRLMNVILSNEEVPVTWKDKIYSILINQDEAKLVNLPPYLQNIIRLNSTEADRGKIATHTINFDIDKLSTEFNDRDECLKYIKDILTHHLKGKIKELIKDPNFLSDIFNNLLSTTSLMEDEGLRGLIKAMAPLLNQRLIIFFNGLFNGENSIVNQGLLTLTEHLEALCEASSQDNEIADLESHLDRIQGLLAEGKELKEDDVHLANLVWGDIDERLILKEWLNKSLQSGITDEVRAIYQKLLNDEQLTVEEIGKIDVDIESILQEWLAKKRKQTLERKPDLMLSSRFCESDKVDPALKPGNTDEQNKEIAERADTALASLDKIPNEHFRAALTAGIKLIHPIRENKKVSEEFAKVISSALNHFFSDEFLTDFLKELKNNEIFKKYFNLEIDIESIRGTFGLIRLGLEVYITNQLEENDGWLDKIIDQFAVTGMTQHLTRSVFPSIKQVLLSSLIQKVLADNPKLIDQRIDDKLIDEVLQRSAQPIDPKVAKEALIQAQVKRFLKTYPAYTSCEDVMKSFTHPILFESDFKRIITRELNAPSNDEPLETPSADDTVRRLTKVLLEMSSLPCWIKWLVSWFIGPIANLLNGFIHPYRESSNKVAELVYPLLEIKKPDTLVHSEKENTLSVDESIQEIAALIFANATYNVSAFRGFFIKLALGNEGSRIASVMKSIVDKSVLKGSDLWLSMILQLSRKTELKFKEAS